MYILEKGTIDEEVEDMVDDMTETRDSFLEDIESFIRRAAPAGTTVSAVPMSYNDDEPTEKGVHFQFFDKRWIEASASSNGWSIRRSDLFHVAGPWYKEDDPLSFVEKPVKGFFTVMKH